MDVFDLHVQMLKDFANKPSCDFKEAKSHRKALEYLSDKTLAMNQDLANARLMEDHLERVAH